MKTEAWIGLDVHKNSITLALVAGRSEKESLVQKLSNSPGVLLKLLRKLALQYDLHVCYEAGPCGYTLYRKFAAAGIRCTVVAPSLIPVDLKKVKTDRLDAVKLAKYFRAGLLTAVNVPDAELENDRDLVRLRAAQVRELTRIKQQFLAFLRKRHFALCSKGKHINAVKTALASELVAFVWEATMYHYGGELHTKAAMV